MVVVLVYWFIGFCNDVVMGIVVVALVTFCGVKGCYFVVLEVL